MVVEAKTLVAPDSETGSASRVGVSVAVVTSVTVPTKGVARLVTHVRGSVTP